MFKRWGFKKVVCVSTQGGGTELVSGREVLSQYEAERRKNVRLRSACSLIHAVFHLRRTDKWVSHPGSFSSFCVLFKCLFLLAECHRIAVWISGFLMNVLGILKTKSNCVVCGSRRSVIGELVNRHFDFFILTQETRTTQPNWYHCFGGGGVEIISFFQIPTFHGLNWTVLFWCLQLTNSALLCFGGSAHGD